MSSLNHSFILRTNWVNIAERTIQPVRLFVENGIIKNIENYTELADNYLLMGFIDAHVHVESSMIIPSEFARLAVPHGTIATVSDPHEIGNVLGVKGVRFMIRNGEKVPFKFYFGAPSCVPATPFETAGATITAEDITELFESEKSIKYLAEMMNYPGVLFDDELVMSKIEVAKKYGKVIDGHAPAIEGKDIIKYASAGISTDHECVTKEEALEKLKAGMKILIREGSAAKNFEALVDLIPEHYENIMFCSDDKHPDNLVEGHINQLVIRAVERGIDVFKVLQCACLNPISHYNLEVGQIRIGDPADFILVDNLQNFKVLATYINGEKVAENGKSFINSVKSEILNQFQTNSKIPSQFEILAQSNKIRVIEALDGELITNEIITQAKIEDGKAITDLKNDILKLAVVNRYENAEPTLAFIKNFGLKSGAIASSVGHDSHNITAVGTTDIELCRAVNLVIENQGGISAVFGSEEWILPLPVAGIMSPEDGYTVAEKYKKMDAFVKSKGCTLGAPFMTLAFMALLVIPDLKLSDKGLFSGKKFTFTDLFLPNPS